MAACGDLDYMKARPVSFQRAQRTGPNFLGRPCLITHGPQEGLRDSILAKDGSGGLAVTCPRKPPPRPLVTIL